MPEPALGSEGEGEGAVEEEGCPDSGVRAPLLEEGCRSPQVMPEAWVSHVMPEAWVMGCWESCGAPAQHRCGPSHLGKPRGIATPFWGQQGGG